MNVKDEGNQRKKLCGDLESLKFECVDGFE